MGVVIEYGNDSRTQGGYNARMRIPLASAAGHLDYEHSVPQDVLNALALLPAGSGTSDLATGLPDAGEIGAVRAAKHVRRTMRQFARRIGEIGYAGGSVDPGQAAAGVFAQVLPILGGLMGGVFGGPAGAALGSAAGDAGAMGVRALAGQGASVDPSQMVDALTRQLAQAMGLNPGSLLTALASLPTKKSIGAIAMGVIPGVTRRTASVSMSRAMPALAQRSFGPVQPSRRQLSDPTPPPSGGGTQLYPGGPLVNYTAGGLLVDDSGNVYDPHSGQQTGNIHSAAFAPVTVGPEGLVDPNTGKAFPRAGVVSTPSVYAFDPSAGITVSAPPGGPPQQAQPSWSAGGPGGGPQAQGPQSTGQTAASTPVAPGSSQGPTVPLGTDAQGNNYAADPSTGQVYQQDSQGNVSTSGDPVQWQAALDAFGVDPNALASMAQGYDPSGYAAGYAYGQDPYAMASQGYGYDPTTGQYEDRYGNIPNVNDYAAQEIDQSQQGTTQELSGLIAPDTVVHSDDWFQLLGAAGLIASLMAMRRGGVPIPDDVVDLLARAMARVELLTCAALGIAPEDYVAQHCAYLDSRSPDDRKAGDIVHVIAGVEIGHGRRRRAHGRG
jgi:hypothetical protein